MALLVGDKSPFLLGAHLALGEGGVLPRLWAAVGCCVLLAGPSFVHSSEHFCVESQVGDAHLAIENSLCSARKGVSNRISEGPIPAALVQETPVPFGYSFARLCEC